MMFTLVVTGILTVIHLYIAWRSIHATAVRSPWRRRIGFVLAMMFFATLAALFLRRRLFVDWATPFVGFGFLWLGACGLLAGLLFVTDLILATHRVVRRKQPIDESRRVFLARSTAVGAWSVVGATSGIGFANAHGEIDDVEVPVRLARLPRALDGVRIVQLSDMHVSSQLGESFTRRVVEQVNAKKPDLVVITGDLVDGTTSDLADAVAPLIDLRSRWGTWFCTGNHEFYSGVRDWLALLPELGVRTLANERVSIGDAAASFDLAGVHDHAGRRLTPRLVPDLDRACAGRDPDRELVLLAHRPRVVADAAKAGVGLQLSGHTHGGQIFPFGAIVMLSEPYLAGLHAHTESTQIYVSRGTGFWGPPIRFLAPAEITTLVLHA